MRPVSPLLWGLFCNTELRYNASWMLHVGYLDLGFKHGVWTPACGTLEPIPRDIFRLDTSTTVR